MKRQGLSHTAFSQLIGVRPATLSDLKLRIEAPAPTREAIRQWATLLNMDAAEEEVLFDLIQLAHAPGYVQTLVARYRPQTAERKRVAEDLMSYQPLRPRDKR